MLWLFKHRFVSDPHEGAPLSDTHETWQQLLDDPQVIADDDEDAKEAASVLCGAKYLDEVKNRDKEGVEGVTCLVLDVDESHNPTGTVPGRVELENALSGLRAIVYASPSHTAQKPRWRLLLPLATPVPPKKHRSLVRWFSENLVEGYNGCINVDATGDPCRLGFVGVTKHPEDYRWWEHHGELFDWTRVEGLEDEEWIDLPLQGLDRQPQWTDRETALELAKKYYGTRGYEEVKDGEHRILIIHKIAMELWWLWAAEDEEFVMEAVLDINNNQFSEPKDPEDVYRKVREAHDRTIGKKRKAQLNGPYGSKREPSNNASVAAIKHLSKRLRRSHNPHTARKGEEMYRMIKKDTIADDPNTWRSAIARCAQELAVHFNNDKKERIAEFFQPALNTMIAAMHGVTTAVPSIQEIETWIGVKLEGERKRKKESSARVEDSTRKVISFATAGRRDTPYTPEEVDAWMAPNGVGLSERSWLLVEAKKIHVFIDGSYSEPYSELEFEAQGYVDLEAASQFVRFRTFDDEGQPTPAPLRTLLHKYGSKCNTVIDYTCDRSWFRAEDRTLVLPGPRRAPLEPKFHQLVDEFYRRATGRPSPANEKARREEAARNMSDVYGLNEYDTFCDWQAAFTQVGHTCSALVAVGPGGTGKTLVADGLARILKGGKITPQAALGDFNAKLADSWFIHVDEGLPTGMSASVLLRRTLSATEHIMTRKYNDSEKINGCVRIMFTMNNMDLFNNNSKGGKGEKQEKLEVDDLDALGERFVKIKFRMEAAEYLKSIGTKHHEFVTNNMIAEHALWLGEKRWLAVKQRDLRFLVAGRNTDVSDVVATSVDSTSDVCSALTEALVEQKERDWFWVRNGQIFVNTPMLRKVMQLHNVASRYTDKEIARAVSSISNKHENVRVTDKSGKKIRTWTLRTEALKNWCDNTKVYDWNDILAGIDKLNRNEEFK